jgi:hypothetical protein
MIKHVFHYNVHLLTYIIILYYYVKFKKNLIFLSGIVKQTKITDYILHGDNCSQICSKVKHSLPTFQIRQAVLVYRVLRKPT